MDLKAEKKRIIQELKNTDEEWVILSIKRLLNIEEETVAFTVKGKPLSKADYIEKVLSASARAKTGKLISQEEAEKQAESW